MRYYALRGLRDLSFLIGVCVVVFTTMYVRILAGVSDPCMSVKIPLSERIQASRAVIYGRVISQHATWDDARRSIYTINTVVVHDVWKSVSVIGDTINVLTEGGDMGTMGRTVVGTLRLDVGDEGYLLLEHPRHKDVTFGLAGAESFYRPYAEVQALLAPSDNGELRDCWGGTLLSNTQFEKKYLENLPYEIRSPRIVRSTSEERTRKPHEVIQGSITFTPSRIIGGMGEAVTITGDGFGAERGSSYVTFTSDGTNYHSADYARSLVYRKWSNTEIIVEVPPSYSNKVRVVVGSTVHESVETLRVTSNLAARSINPLSFTNLINTNAKGGYTWSLDKALFDVPQARECVESVMRQFRCKTGMMFDVNPAPATAGYALNDGINAIVFDAPGYELGAGAVAYCDWIWYSCIVGTETFYYVRDSDCRLSRKFNWYYGNGKNPEFGMAKLRYVLYHEIGHAHQFGHVSEWGESMHPIVQALPAEEWLERDTITASEKRAGTFMTMQGRNFTFRGCGIQPLTAPTNDDCNSDITSNVHDESLGSRHQLHVYPNPASEAVSVSSNEQRLQDIHIDLYDILGSKVSSVVMPAGSDPVVMNLTNVAPGRYVLRATMNNQEFVLDLLTIGR
jgi:hypothetical protein